jgi:serine/threonine-protein kinase
MAKSIKSMNFDHLVGQPVGSSVLLKKLDQGAMSVLFVAFQKTLKRQIAVKILPKSLLTPKVADFFHQEAEAAAFLSHPYIIPVYEIGETDNFLYFTMQLVKGVSLAHCIQQARKNVLPSRRMLPVRQVLTYIVKILDGLEYAHGLGIVHRDIKPSNILIEDHSKRPIITDFGVARSYGSCTSEDRILVGTPKYMAPEQIVSSIVDGQADVYAAGVMLFEMLTGVLPYPPCNSALNLLKIKLRLQDRLFQKKPSQMNAAVDAQLDEIIHRAIAFDKQHRFGTCRDFAWQIENYLDTRFSRAARAAL